MKKIKLFLLGLVLSFNAAAIIPENGWWWNPSENGRGFNLEVQDNLLFLASFAYDANGNPAWYTAGGAMTSDRDWTAQLVVSTRGQCFGCAYVAPTLVNAGTVSLRFTSSQTAVLTVNGVSINVQRLDFWAYNTRPEGMLGEWSAVIGASGDIFDGERIQYSAKQTDSSGTYLAGKRLGSSSSTNPAVVSYSSSTGQWTALLDSSSSFYRLFRFSNTGFNRVEGSFWIYSKGSQPSGNGTFYQAFKTASYAFLTSGTGPASTKRGAIVDMSVYERRDAALFANLSGAKEAAPADIIETAARLEARLNDVRVNDIQQQQ